MPRKPISCRWCDQVFPTDEARREHTSNINPDQCEVKKRVHRAEIQGGRALTVAEVIAVRDRARKEIAMDRERYR